MDNKKEKFETLNRMYEALYTLIQRNKNDSYIEEMLYLKDKLWALKEKYTISGYRFIYATRTYSAYIYAYSEEEAKQIFLSDPSYKNSTLIEIEETQ